MDEIKIELPKRVTLDPTEADPAVIEEYRDNEMMFNYFAYGTNLWSKCMNLHSPDALRIDIGKLDNYRLDFVGYADEWEGSVATAVPSENHTLWGAIWIVERQGLESLDAEKGVDKGIYIPIERCIERPNGTTIMCRMYEHSLEPPEGDFTQLTRDRYPSATYLDMIRKGAHESELPKSYRKFLYNLPDNGKTFSLENCYNINFPAADNDELE